MKKEVVPNDSKYVPLTQQKWCCVPTCIQMVMLRHKIPLVPAELMGYHMGLVVADEAREFFYNPRTGPRPPSGYGTQIGKPMYGPNAVFKRMNIPLKMSWSLINLFKDVSSFREYLDRTSRTETDTLVCFDWPTLFDPKITDHWGHVCVLDKVDPINDMIRIIDPSPNSAKWLTINISSLYQAMIFHTHKKSGGFWELTTTL